MLNSIFSRFVTSSGLTNLADGIATVAWAWLASLLTRDPLLISLVPIMLRLPWFLFAIPAGMVTDRSDRRLLIIRMDVLRAIAFGLTGIAVWASLPLVPAQTSGVSNLPLFLALMLGASATGIAEVFRDNAAQTLLPSLVPHNELEKANGRLWSVEIIGNSLLGPAIGAYLIAWSLPMPFLANAIAYLCSIYLVFAIRGNFVSRNDVSQAWREELKEGFHFLMKHRLLRSLAWITGFWNLLFQMVFIALVLHTQENLQLGVRAYGLILASSAIGGIIGSLAGDSMIKRWGPGRVAQWMLVASAPAFLAMAFAPGPITLGLTLAVFEFTGLVWNTVSVSYRQRTIPDFLLGRVNSLYRLLAWGMMPIGLMLSGLLVNLTDGPLSRESALITPFLVAAIGALILGALGWRELGHEFGKLEPGR